jgi:uncharacterized protein (TIGR02452 family)
MNNRDNRKQIAEETLAILEKGSYSFGTGEVDIKESLNQAINNTKLYIDTNAFEPAEGNYTTEIKVTNETTNEGMEHFVASGLSDIACLNFASAKNPGGGFKGGSQAQEECIARSSGMYACLSPIDDYYLFHRKMKSCFYSDRTIFSPEVPFFRNYKDELLQAPYNAGVITSAAVNFGVVKQRETDKLDQVEPAMKQRIAHVLNVALDNGVKNIVLGAWGCGVFMNDRKLMAKLFSDHLGENGAFYNAFERITFAVLDRNNKGIYSAFEDAFRNS